MSGRADSVHRFSQGLGLTTCGAALGVGVDFCSFTLAARSVSKTEFGIFALFLVLGRFAQVASDVGLRQAVVQHLSSGRGVQAHIFQVSLTIQTITSILTAGGLFASGSLLGKLLLGVPLPKSFVGYLCSLVIVQGWHQLFSGTLQGLRRYRSYLGGELTRSLARLVLVIVLVTRMKWGVDGLMLAAVLAVFAAAVSQIALIRLPVLFRTSVPEWRQLMAFALPLGLNGALGVTFDRLNRVLLGAFSGPVPVALFEAASRVPDAGIQVYMGFQSAFFPNISALFSSDGAPQAAAAVNRTLRLLCFAGSMAILAPYTFRKEVVTLLFSPAYSDAAGTFGILLAGLVVAVTNNLLHSTLIASGSTRAALKAGIFQGVVTTTLYLALIPQMGYRGAAYGYVLGNILVNPVVLWMLKRRGVNIKAGSYLKPISLLTLSIGASMTIRSPLVGLGAALALFIVAGILTDCIGMHDVRYFQVAKPLAALEATEALR